jgi:hypothetical protein
VVYAVHEAARAVRRRVVPARLGRLDGFWREVFATLRQQFLSDGGKRESQSEAGVSMLTDGVP